MGLFRQRPAQRPGERLDGQLRRRHLLHLQRRHRLRRADGHRLDLGGHRLRGPRHRRPGHRRRHHQHLRPDGGVEHRVADRRHLSQRPRHHLLLAVRHLHRLRPADDPAGRRLGHRPGDRPGEPHRPDSGGHLPLPPGGDQQRRHRLRLRLHDGDADGQQRRAGQHGRARRLRAVTPGPDPERLDRRLEPHAHQLHLPVAALDRRRHHLEQHQRRHHVELQRGRQRSQRADPVRRQRHQLLWDQRRRHHAGHDRLRRAGGHDRAHHRGPRQPRVRS